MSMTALLVPMAVALCITAAETIDAMREKCVEMDSEEAASQSIQTRFNDRELLHKSLSELGVDFLEDSETCVSVRCSCGILEYRRPLLSEPFMLSIKNVHDVDGLVNDLVELETVYDSNVQSFTYHKILSNLPPNMTIEEEILMEDDSIMLTLSVTD